MDRTGLLLNLLQLHNPNFLPHPCHPHLLPQTYHPSTPNKQNKKAGHSTEKICITKRFVSTLILLLQNSNWEHHANTGTKKNKPLTCKQELKIVKCYNEDVKKEPWNKLLQVSMHIN